MALPRIVRRWFVAVTTSYPRDIALTTPIQRNTGSGPMSSSPRCGQEAASSILAVAVEFRWPGGLQKRGIESPASIAVNGRLNVHGS